MLITGCSLVYGGNSKMLFRVRSPVHLLAGNLRVKSNIYNYYAYVQPVFSFLQLVMNSKGPFGAIPNFQVFFRSFFHLRLTAVFMVFLLIVAVHIPAVENNST